MSVLCATLTWQDPPEDGEGEPAGEQDGASAEKVGEGEPAGQQASGAGSGKETA